jgi:ABC-type multidrug transport system fused ATPase/permease subunit
LAAIFVIVILLQAWSNILERIIAEKAARDLQFTIFQKLRSLGFPYYEKHAVGESLALMNTEVAAIQQLYREYFPAILKHFLTVMVIFIILVFMNIQLVLMMLPIFVLYYYVGPIFERKTIHATIQNAADRIALNKKYYESNENVGFAYEQTLPLVLQGLNITIPAGKKVAFVGTSGGGKSTIAQMLIRFFEPTHGRILINGLPLSQVRRKDWLERIDIVFQEPYLFPDTIRVNITLGRDEITVTQLTDAFKTVQIHHVFDSLPNGYDTEVGERGVTLSGGQRQRLALARAILLNPEILILDEATSALDLETERQLQKCRAN